jgi:hypothetical protein
VVPRNQCYQLCTVSYRPCLQFLVDLTDPERRKVYQQWQAEWDAPALPRSYTCLYVVGSLRLDHVTTVTLGPPDTGVQV